MVVEAELLKSLIRFVKENNYICPMPDPWNYIYSILRNIDTNKDGEIPPVPLILGAWGMSGNWEKRSVFFYHLKYAQRHGSLVAVDEYLRNLPSNKWLIEEKYEQH